MKKILFIILAITVISCNSNNNKNLSSPDGKIKIDFRIDNGVAIYSVKKNNSMQKKITAVIKIVKMLYI